MRGNKASSLTSAPTKSSRPCSICLHQRARPEAVKWAEFKRARQRRNKPSSLTSAPTGSSRPCSIPYIGDRRLARDREVGRVQASDGRGLLGGLWRCLAINIKCLNIHIQPTPPPPPPRHPTPFTWLGLPRCGTVLILLPLLTMINSRWSALHRETTSASTSTH
jgi:hypothetical protein